MNGIGWTFGKDIWSCDEAKQEILKSLQIKPNKGNIKSWLLSEPVITLLAILTIIMAAWFVTSLGLFLGPCN